MPKINQSPCINEAPKAEEVIRSQEGKKSTMGVALSISKSTSTLSRIHSPKSAGERRIDLQPADSRDPLATALVYSLTNMTGSAHISDKGIQSLTSASDDVITEWTSRNQGPKERYYVPPSVSFGRSGDMAPSALLGVSSLVSKSSSNMALAKQMITAFDASSQICQISVGHESLFSTSLASQDDSSLNVDGIFSRIDSVVYRLIKSGKLDRNETAGNGSDLHQRTLRNNTAELLQNLAIFRARRSHHPGERMPLPSEGCKRSRLSSTPPAPRNTQDRETARTPSPAPRTGCSFDSPNIAKLRARRDQAAMIIRQETQRLSGKTPSGRSDDSRGGQTPEQQNNRQK